MRAPMYVTWRMGKIQSAKLQKSVLSILPYCHAAKKMADYMISRLSAFTQMLYCRFHPGIFSSKMIIAHLLY